MRRIRAIAFDAYGTLFDVHSVGAAVDELFPGHGAAVSEVWRTKQLEYTWLRSLMDRYEDFWTLTRDALVFALKAAGLPIDDDVCDRLLDATLHLAPFAEVPAALQALKPRPLHIFSNGSPAMLEAMVANAALDGLLDGIISVDEAGIYKPSPRCYALVPDKLGVAAEEVLFVSSNAWDAAGAKNFGFTVAWIRRSATTMDELALPPDVEVEMLTDLVGWLP